MTALAPDRNTLASALDLASLDIPVFPCRDDKKPATAHGFKDASTDADAVRKLWRRHPGPLVGVPTGAASGLDVLDIDPRHGGERWWIQHSRRIPATRMHRTRSDGLHVLFRHVEPVRNTESTLARGVDTRGEGGYIVWWPAHGCRVEEAPIAAWPAWLLERLLSRPEPPVRLTVSSPTLDPDDAAHRIAQAVLGRLASATDGQRHYRLRAAACTLGGLLDHLPMGADEAQRRLLDAAKQAGAADMENAARTAAWGLAKGRTAPLALGRQ